jgi:hypothetical protein
MAAMVPLLAVDEGVSATSALTLKSDSPLQGDQMDRAISSCLLYHPEMGPERRAVDETCTLLVCVHRVENELTHLFGLSAEVVRRLDDALDAGIEVGPPSVIR